MVGIVANFEVAEALKILTGNFDRVSRRLLNVDLWDNSLHQLNVTNARDAGDCQRYLRCVRNSCEGIARHP